MGINKISGLRRSATSKFFKPLLRFLCNRKAAKVAADEEARAQNAANEALEALLEGRFHAAPDRDIALCGTVLSHQHQRAEEQHSPSLHSVHDDHWFTY